MKELLQRLIDLAKEWRKFSYMSNGRSRMDYCDGGIRCYFADNSDHTAVYFRTKQFSDTIQVAFHSPPEISGLRMRSVNGIDAMIGEYSELLEAKKVAFANLSEEEIKISNQEVIDTLEQRLTEAKAERKII